jgi:hypothetical protein
LYYESQPFLQFWLRLPFNNLLKISAYLMRLADEWVVSRKLCSFEDRDVELRMVPSEADCKEVSSVFAVFFYVSFFSSRVVLNPHSKPVSRTSRQYALAVLGRSGGSGYSKKELGKMKRIALT